VHENTEGWLRHQSEMPMGEPAEMPRGFMDFVNGAPASENAGPTSNDQLPMDTSFMNFLSGQVAASDQGAARAAKAAADRPGKAAASIRKPVSELAARSDKLDQVLHRGVWDFGGFGSGRPLASAAPVADQADSDDDDLATGKGSFAMFVSGGQAAAATRRARKQLPPIDGEKANTHDFQAFLNFAITGHVPGE